MNLVQSSIKRFIQRLSMVVLLIFAANVVLLGIYIFRLQRGASGELGILTLLKKFPEELTLKNKQYHLGDEIKAELDKQHMWSMLIDDRAGNVLWSYRLPKEIPVQYSLNDVAAFSRYYYKDYPVFNWEHPNGLIVVGAPKNSFWKAAYVLPYAEFKAVPAYIILVILCDLLIVFLLYLYIDRRSLIAVSNILGGIQSLASGKPIQLKEKGTFSDVADQLNKTSDLLKKRNVAQENWIMGISHDVRTPLTVILGYAESIETNSSLPEEVQQKASLIKCQGIRLRNLVNDLNLMTRLEDIGKVNRQELFQPVIFCRELMASFLNNEIPDSFSVEFYLDKSLASIKLQGDKHLLQRAIHNLLYNCIKHNPDGCKIHFSASRGLDHVLFIVSDNGKGMVTDEISLLKIRSQYLTGSELFHDKQHGFGLYIVQQIVKMHAGKIYFKKNLLGGLDAIMELPIS